MGAISGTRPWEHKVMEEWDSFQTLWNHSRRPSLSAGIYKCCLHVENGFLLNDGAKKSALFLPVKQYPDVVLFFCGCK